MGDWLAGQPCEPLAIVGGDGAWLIDADGRRYLDGVSSLWCNIHGHRHPAIDAAIGEQLGKIAHSTFLGLTNEPAVLLAEQLIRRAMGNQDAGTPGHRDAERIDGATTSFSRLPSTTEGRREGPAPTKLARVFYSDSGATACEIAAKIAFHYWQLRGQPGRTKFVSFTLGYHGDTIGMVSLGGIDLFQAIYRPLLFATLHAPAAYCYRCQFEDCPCAKNDGAMGRWGDGATKEDAGTPGRRDAGTEEANAKCKMVEKVTPERLAATRSPVGAQGSASACDLPCLRAVDRLLSDNAGQVAAVFVEPLIQGAAGIITSPPGYLAELRAITRRHDVLLVADEVAVGFGRTGSLFACQQEGVTPDLMCLAKGITAGYLPLAATLVSEAVFEPFTHPGVTFYHGHTYTGNALAAAAGLASLRVFDDERVLELLPAKIERFAARLERVRRHRNVGDIRRRGLFAGVELVADRATKGPFPADQRIGAAICHAARKHGLIIRPLGDVLVFVPPLCVTVEQIDAMFDAVEAAMAEVGESQIANCKLQIVN